LPLTATEFWLLEFLMSRPGVVYSREHDRAVTDRMVDVYILRLRHKIEADPTNPTFILAVRGFGYSFNEYAMEPKNNAVTVTSFADH
jgi:DNA-binding response OmpR family regulator